MVFGNTIWDSKLPNVFIFSRFFLVLYGHYGIVYLKIMAFTFREDVRAIEPPVRYNADENDWTR